MHYRRPLLSTAVRLVLLAALVPVVLTGCETAYYGAMEKIGLHKRDILASRVEAAGEAQVETREQFRSALERFRSVVEVDGGELAQRYDALAKEYERSEAGADEVRERIAAVEDVAEALFDEWTDELSLYTNPDLRRASKRQLDQTRARYAELLAAMRRAESRMEPVLGVFRDQVLFLKHNLNARAVASLKGELASVESDVERLVREMDRAIAESEQFVKGLRSG